MASDATWHIKWIVTCADFCGISKTLTLTISAFCSHLWLHGTSWQATAMADRELQFKCASTHMHRVSVRVYIWENRLLPVSYSRGIKSWSLPRIICCLRNDRTKHFLSLVPFFPFLLRLAFTFIFDNKSPPKYLLWYSFLEMYETGEIFWRGCLMLWLGALL